LAKLAFMKQLPPRPAFARSLTHTALVLLCATALGISACGGGGGGGSGDGALGNEQPLDSSQAASTTGRATVLGAQLNAPWGLAFLPGGNMLATEKGGTVALVDSAGAGVLGRLSGPPGVDATGQGGLLDIALDPNFASSRWVYLTFSESGAGGAGTALARGKLNAALNGWEQSPGVIWQQTPKVTPGQHYGARIAFRSDQTMYIAVGERGMEANDGNARADGVQSTNNTIGKVVRLNLDGTPADGSALGVWSTGHRNPQGAAVRPGSNELWITEHGPQGGDELNLVVQGGNYGWPLKSYGCNYDESKPKDAACRIGGGTHAPTYIEPKSIWVPTSTAPSGLLFYTGTTFPEWQNNVFSGALGGATLWRIVLDGNGSAVSRQEITSVKNLGVRIRDVRQGPDGNIYLLTNGDSGPNANRIVRLAP
jgi:aldose sugar dehydrogenase